MVGLDDLAAAEAGFVVFDGGACFFPATGGEGQFEKEAATGLEVFDGVAAEEETGASAFFAGFGDGFDAVFGADGLEDAAAATEGEEATDSGPANFAGNVGFTEGEAEGEAED